MGIFFNGGGRGEGGIDVVDLYGKLLKELKSFKKWLFWESNWSNY